MRIRPTLLACAAVLAALTSPATAAADGGGGVAAPVGGGESATEAGGTAFGTPVPAAHRQSRIDARRRKAARRRAARRRAARREAARRRDARRRAVTPPPAPVIPTGDHVFPVAGAYTLGGEDSRFGAPREGHVHRGQDIAAASGTPVVAPYSGVVDWVRYQSGGAGHYVVLDADDDYDYVFMHLRGDSITVAEGQRVVAGAQLGEVGNSGRSSGPHLHFEVWVGGWYENGGQPIDPLPLLEAWAG